MGSLSHPELTAESPHHASGNYGLMDQAAALAWVKRNIAGFGGDPEEYYDLWRVGGVVFGEFADGFAAVEGFDLEGDWGERRGVS